MILLRSLMYEIVLVGSVVVFGTCILVLGLFGSQQALDRIGRAWGRVNMAALRRLCGLRYRVRGQELLPAEASIVLCKHQSAWETIALWCLVPPQQSWVLKQELMRVPFLGIALERLRSIAIDRSAGRRAMVELVREGRERLERGRWVIIFPEGTRVAPGSRRPYAIGGAVLAERTGRLVVPIAHNAGCFWGRRSIRKLPGVIDVVIGPAIQTRGRKAADINAEVERWIESTVASLPGRGVPDAKV